MDKLLELLRLKDEFYDKESEKVRKSSLRKYETYAAKWLYINLPVFNYRSW